MPGIELCQRLYDRVEEGSAFRPQRNIVYATVDDINLGMSNKDGGMVPSPPRHLALGNRLAASGTL